MGGFMTWTADWLLVFASPGPLAGHKVTIPPAGISIGRVADNALVLVQDGAFGTAVF